MKPIWVILCCAACFFIGCNVGEERIKSKIRAALQRAGEAMGEAASAMEFAPSHNFDSVEASRGSSTLTLTPEEMRQILIRKDGELEQKENAKGDAR